MPNSFCGLFHCPMCSKTATNQTAVQCQSPQKHSHCSKFSERREWDAQVGFAELCVRACTLSKKMLLLLLYGDYS